MIDLLLRKVFGSKHERDVKRMRPARRRRSTRSRPRSAAGRTRPSARAPTSSGRSSRTGPSSTRSCPRPSRWCREVGRRRLGMRHFDVQLMGGMVLHEGKIAEMATGEGKTLVATLPAVLNALTGRGVHIVTVNDYLARRDAQWMGPIYHALGLSVGVIQHEASFLYDPAYVPADIRLAGAPAVPAAGGLPRRHHLRDEQRVRLRLPARQHAVLARRAGPARAALRHRRRGRLDPDRRGADPADHLGPGGGVDRPLLQGRPDHSQAHARGDHRRGQALTRSRRVRQGDYIVDEKAKTVIADRGRASPAASSCLGVDNLYDPQHIDTLHHIHQGLRAHALFQQGRGLRRQGRPGHHRRRVHRPPDARPALVGRPPPGGRGQGRASGSSRRTRPSPRSPSRTTSGCTTSSPA